MFDFANWRRESASVLTTFKGGGSALTYFPKSQEEFFVAFEALAGEGITPYILGGGSNVVIADGEIETPVICTKHMRGLTFEDGVARFEAGVSIAQLMAEARKRGLGGLEFLEGVPATMGGALRMNAGAFGSQMSDLVLSARILRQDGGKFEFADVLPDFAYRRGADGVIAGGAIRLERMSAQDSLRRRDEFLAKRRAKQPRLPSCGSAFKNISLTYDEASALGLDKYTNRMPKNADEQGDMAILPAGRLIDECGLKGRRIGGAMISQLHANFIVNAGGAKASDFLALANLAQNAVFDKFGVPLQREFVLLS